ncbi:hypothetical protein [Robiginitalea aurantiaca]|uniref:Uncharacterized protein n=1 Tax=Robiginitalea aurantiaca TaxID=3056915 RepID=A0ABT7WF68_9FLAO|nr:hypothetical protein [Robiginitalea aurantiaca]MDM9631560.1 hypothetical protein [Robiginitalea aurantiaca]
METTVIYNSDLHFEHERWKSELLFSKDEMRSFKNRLEELVTRWTDRDVLMQLEHFQNEFILHEGRINEFLEGIEAHEHQIAGKSKKGENSMDTILFKNHLEFREEMEMQRELFQNLKKEFFAFLTRYM